jgi:hypothetical protein
MNDIIHNGELFLDTGVSNVVKEAIDASFDRICLPNDVRTPLCDLMRKQRSDKGYGPWGKHNYTQFYYELFCPYRAEVKKFLEVGLGTNNTDIPSNMGKGGTPGASLRGWRDFFENASIFGGDVDKRILFEEERIKTFYIDQLDCQVIESSLNSLGASEFDVILDDGLHRFDANRNLYENSIDYLSKDGIYIIEDINCHKDNIDKFKEFLSGVKFPSALIKFPHQRNVPDNCLAVIDRRYG